jgi:hypothetical protein
MRVKTFGMAVIATSVTLAASALACGDKLVALGGGVGFERVMLSRYPGHIVILLEPATGLAAANDRFNLAASLSLAGHEVTVAKSAEELRSRRDAVSPDLILVDASRAAQLEFPAAAGAKTPMIVPVVYSAADGEIVDTQLQTGCVMVAGGKKGSQLLKAVEQALKARSRGQAMPCEKSAQTQQA